MTWDPSPGARQGRDAKSNERNNVPSDEDSKVPATHATDPDPHPYSMRAGVSHAYLATIEFLRSHAPQPLGFDRTIL
jgi:hypothetical protein